MLQDIAPYVYHNEYTPCAPQPEDYLLIYREQELLLRQEEASFSLPKIKELAWSAEQLHISCRYLFSISQKHFFLAAFPLVRHTPLLRPLCLSYEAQRQRTYGLLP